MDSNTILYIFQLLIVLVLFLVIIKLINIIRIIKLEKRINKYALESFNNNELSFFDNIELIYLKFRKKLSKVLKKSKVLRDYSKKYEKYIDKNKLVKEEGMDYISTKFIVAFLAILVIIVSDIFWLRVATFLQISLGFLVGFFVPDIFLLFTRKITKKEIEDDLLKAITIMNNAFKSGNSIMQAIDIVSKEIDGPLSNEFKKMYIDLNYGLSLDVVFKRFSKRVDVEEVKYMTTSLTILNKTGGNIANVFSSIEKSFFARRKLKQEMKALTSTANFMFKILAFIPIGIILIVVLVNPSYFLPLFTTVIGIIILVIILLLYTLYILVVKKIMKVEGV